MAGMYSISDLLDLLLREGAVELHLLPENPPFFIAHGERVPVDHSAVTSENIAELLQSIASGEQMRELRRCGNAHFIYLFHNWARFAITASMEREGVSVKIRNLAR